MYIVGFRDRVAGQFRDFGVVDNIDVFKRTVGSVLRQGSAPYLWAQFPADHELFICGSIDSVTGCITSTDNTYICRVDELAPAEEVQHRGED